MHVTDGQLEALMQGKLVGGDLQDDSRAVEHLESCASCRRRLQQLSGEGAWFSELLDLIRDDDCRHHERPVAPSVVITTEASDELDMHQTVHCESVRLDFLKPPRHPELLGRLGRYDIEQLIGVGGFGVVLKARDSELNRVVAIKALAPHLMSSGPARKRFAREAQASAAVVHDHVVPIYDVVSQADTCYFVMQYVGGDSLQQRVDREGPLPVKDVLRIAAQTAAGLQAAHAQGLIHRDVKPSNILLEDSVDRVLISDFGLARTADDASITRSGVISGTPHYMSPEQARGMAIDTRSDLFSLGSVIYFMCSGHAPFRAPRMMAVLHRICQEPHRSLLEIDNQIPAELADIVDRLLSKSAASRYGSAEAVQRELEQLLHDLQAGTLRPRRKRARGHHRSRGLAAACALGLSLVIWSAWRHWPDLLPVAGPESADTLRASEPAAADPPQPDLYATLLHETNQLLSETEPHSRQPTAYDGFWSWAEQLTQLQTAVTRLEDALAVDESATAVFSAEGSAVDAVPAARSTP